MKILFRVDSYPKVGMGHLIRSLFIAEKLIEKDNNVKLFFLSKLDIHSKKQFEKKPITLIEKDNNNKTEEDYIESVVQQIKPEKIFIDNLYPYSIEFISQLRNKVQVIFFHNLCEARFSVNKFILPSAHTSEEIISAPDWNQNDTTFYHGAKYVIINNKIIEAKALRADKKEIKEDVKIVITTGGSDPKGVMIKLLEWLGNIELAGIEIVALKGQSFIHTEKLISLKKRIPSYIKIKEYDVNELIDADIAIATFGVSSYELLFLEIPLISIGHAEANALGSKIINDRYNCLVDLGLIDDLERSVFELKLKQFISSYELRDKLSKNGSSLVDGKGVDRVIEIICSNK